MYNALIILLKIGPMFGKDAYIVLNALSTEYFNRDGG